MSKAAMEAPAHLGDTMKAFWVRVLADYVLEEHHRLILLSACECWDAVQAARQEREQDGLTSRAAKIELENRAMFLRCIRELGLDIAAPEAPRPPVRTGRGTR